MPKGRSRSKSRKAKSSKQKASTKEEATTKETMAVFPEKVPWITSTPTSRLQTKMTDSTSGQAKEADPPQQSGAPSAQGAEVVVSLTEEEAQVLQSLRSLQTMKMQLTPEMEHQLECLQTKEAQVTSSKALTHGHLNRLHKLKNQVSASAQKIVNLDSEWKAFVNRTMSKVKEHALLYQQCRADLMEAHNQKRSELMAVKDELSTASKSLLGQAQAIVEVPDMPDVAEAMQAFQDVISEEGTVGAIDLTDEMEEDEGFTETETVGSKGKPARQPRPFRGATSPTKVASLHLKVKSDTKDAKEARKEEK